MIETIASSLGCKKDVDNGPLLSNPGLAAALFFSALCGSFLGGESKDPQKRILPGRRLTDLFSAIGPDCGSFEMTDEEAWNLVNTTAKRLWGRDALEEIELDINKIEKSISLENSPWLKSEGLFEAWTDFIALRRKLLAAVRAAGSASLGPRAFPLHWINRLKPWRIIATPGGKFDGSIPDVVFGRNFNPPPGLEAIVPKVVTWGQLIEPKEQGDIFSVAAREAWHQMLEHHAPRALLMENGRRHRLMIPPQLERPLEEMRSRGFTPCFEPIFEYPEIRSARLQSKDAQELADWSGRGEFVCDVTGDTISKSEAALLTPWEYRRLKLGRTNVAETNEIQKIVDTVRDACDWSDWVVKKALLNSIAPLRVGKTEAKGVMP